MNSDVPTLIRALLTGGEATELESLLTEGVGLVRRPTIARRDAARRRSSLTLINIDDPLLANVQVRTSVVRFFAARRDVQGHSRSPILVTIESSYATSYYINFILPKIVLVINTNLLPILHRFRDIAFDRSKIAIFGYPSCV